MFASVPSERDRFDRLVLAKGQPTEIQLYGFYDSSEKAYGACLYLRSVNQQGEVTTKLLCSKSKVVPVKKITLPRLELCGALLLAQLIQKTVPVLNLKIDNLVMDRFYDCAFMVRNVS